MSRYCVDVDYCLGCGGAVGLAKEDCECYCHDLKEWEDGAENIHKIDEGGNELIIHTDEDGKKIIRKVSKIEREKFGSIYEN